MPAKKPAVLSNRIAVRLISISIFLGSADFVAIGMRLT